MSTEIVVELSNIEGLKPPQTQPNLEVRLSDYQKVAQNDIDWLLACPSQLCTSMIGLDVEYDGPFVGLIQLATDTRCLLVRVRREQQSQHSSGPLKMFLAYENIKKAGAEITGDALLLFHHLGLLLNGGYDVTRIRNKESLDDSPSAVKSLFAMFSELFLHEGANLRKDKSENTTLWTQGSLSARQLAYAVLDGWVSYKCGVAVVSANSAVLNLEILDGRLLSLLAQHHAAQLAVDELQPCQYLSSFSDCVLQEDGEILVTNNEFANKLNFDDKIKVRTKDDRSYIGRVTARRHGFEKTIKLFGPKFEGTIKRIEVTESNNYTAAGAKASRLFAKDVLHLERSVDDLPFFGQIFMDRPYETSEPNTSYFIDPKLNKSQREAVEAMLSGASPVTMIQGPPGTGKTHTISAAVVASAHMDDHYTVLVAQTNAATRRLAEALFKRDFKDFKIIVADNFYVEWHEDAYKDFNEHVMTSSEFADYTIGNQLERIGGEKTVLLCSLAQLSSHHVITLLKRHKIRHLIIDEASQIPTYALPHIFAIYRSTLRRVSFIGDPKQLAPFSSETFPKLVKSVFDFVKENVHMLKRTYRLPHDIARVISKEVYGGLLQPAKVASSGSVSLHDIRSKELEINGGGFTNQAEAEAVVKAVLTQYGNTDFLVVTPYNKQRELIIHKLRQALKSDAGRHLKPNILDRICSIDTVQGHEAKNVIISLVRSDDIGFLSNENRANVALTRAMEKLIIFGNMNFFLNHANAKKSLFGRFILAMSKNSSIISPANSQSWRRQSVEAPAHLGATNWSRVPKERESCAQS